MRRIFICLFMMAALLTAGVLHSQNVPNGDFESWTIKTLYEDPQDFTTLNAQVVAMGGSNPTVVKSTDSQTGNYAARLVTTRLHGEIVPGMLSTGSQGDMGQGVPYTDTPDSISLLVKQNLVPGDTAMAMVMFTALGSPIAMVDFMFTDTATGYELHQKQVQWFVPGVSPDSVMVMIMSNASWDGGTAGSSITVDEISFGSGYANIPNHDLENWYVVESEEPDHWLTFNVLTPQTNPSVEKTTDSYSGNYAAKITNVLDFNDDTIGFMTNGWFSMDEYPVGGLRVWENPHIISGYYKYDPVGADSAMVAVFSYIWDDAANERIMVDSNFLVLGAASSYTPFEVTMGYDGWPFVDTVNITFVAGHIDEQPELGSQLIVDHVQISYKPVSVKEEEQAQITVMPNPASQFVQAKLPENHYQTLKLYSIDGRLLRQTQVSGNSQITIPTHDLPRGMILMEFTGEHHTTTKKVLLK